MIKWRVRVQVTLLIYIFSQYQLVFQIIIRNIGTHIDYIIFQLILLISVARQREIQRIIELNQKYQDLPFKSIFMIN